MDVTRLEYIIQKLLGSKEFFINKAIGWVLREYSRTNPKWVKDFVANNDLAGLSRREALRLMDWTNDFLASEWIQLLGFHVLQDYANV